MSRSASLLLFLLGVGACAPQGTAQIDDLRSELQEVRTELREVRSELRALRGLPPEAPESDADGEGTVDAGGEAAGDAGPATDAADAVVQDGGGKSAIEEPGDAAPKPAGKRTVKLAIESNPSGAALYIDGKRKGNTPVLLDIPASPDELEIRLDKPGYLPRIQTVRPEEDTKLSLQLSKR